MIPTPVAGASQPAYYNPASWLVPGLVGFAAGAAVGALASPWWGHGYYGGGGWWGHGGYNNININNIHNNVWNRNRPPYHGGRPIVHPVTRPGNHPNLYNRPNNAHNLAQRPGQAGKGRCANGAPRPDRPDQAGPGGSRPGQAPAPDQADPAQGQARRRSEQRPGRPPRQCL